MNPYIQLFRPLNCFMVSVAVLIGAFVAVDYEIMKKPFPVIMAMLSASLFTAWGNTLNDYFDREIDRINHPERPIPSGRIKERDALRISTAMLIAGFLSAIFINRFCLIIFILSALLMLIYELKLKARGFAGNLSISALVALTFIFGGASVGAFTIESSSILILAILAFILSLSREIIKDIEDVSGDLGRETLPMSIGVKWAGAFASILIFTAITLSIIPFALDIFGYPYLIAIGIADAIFIYSIIVLSKSPKHSQLLIKLGMLLALTAFILGGIL